jgi:uncharacterized delta-60 repeat protein
MYLNDQGFRSVIPPDDVLARTARAVAKERTPMSVKGILAAAAVVTASLVSAGLAQPAFAAGGTPGSIDTSFGHNGTAVTDVGLTAAGQALPGTPRSVMVLGNGDILVGGDTGVVRLLPTGSLDPTFGSGGRAPVGFPGGPVTIPGLTVQRDGKILWVGATANTSGGGNLTEFALERFTAGGTPDKTFGRNGLVTLDVPTGIEGGEAFQAAVVQPDGKIVAGGGAGTGGRTGHSNVVLVRYNPNGTLDTSFGSGGMVVGGPGGVQALGLDAAGDIFTLSDEPPAEAEFSPAGVPDAHVTAAPITASTPSHESAGNGVSEAFAFLPTGQTLVGGMVGGTVIGDTDAQVQRLNAGGTVDPAFASPPIDFNGIEGVRGDSAVESLAVQPDGKILIGGNIGLARVNAHGTLDTGFGTGGVEPRVLSTLPVVLSTSALLAVLPNGEFLAIGAGANPATGSVELILTRYFQ